MSDGGESRRMDEPVTLEGEISRMPAWGPVRVLLTVTGLLLIRSVLVLLARYLLALRGRATASVQGNTITLTSEWSLFGRRIRRSRTTAPLGRVTAVRFENRQRYLHLLVGFGALVVGTLVGMQWFLDGLRAGYPYLVLAGAGIIAAGVVIDLCIFLLIPKGQGRTHVVLVLGPWITRLVGVDTGSAQQFLQRVASDWRQ